MENKRRDRIPESTVTPTRDGGKLSGDLYRIPMYVNVYLSDSGRACATVIHASMGANRLFFESIFEPITVVPGSEGGD